MINKKVFVLFLVFTSFAQVLSSLALVKVQQQQLNPGAKMVVDKSRQDVLSAPNLLKEDAKIDRKLLSMDGLDSIDFDLDRSRGHFGPEEFNSNSVNVKLIITNQKSRLQSDLVDCIHTTEDGTWIIAGSVDGTFRIWNTKEKSQPIRFKYDSPITCVTIGQGGMWALVGSTDGKVISLDLSQDLQKVKPVILERGHSNSVSSVAFNSDCTCAVTTAENEPAIIWNFQDKKNITSSYLPRAVPPKLSSDRKKRRNLR